MPIPVSISVYEHAARFVGERPWTVSRDPELLRQAHRKAYETYRHWPVTMGIDIYNLEAECYGAVVEEPEGDETPSIHGPVFGSLDDAMRIEPLDPERDGRIPAFLEAGRRLKEDCPEADVRVPVTGPFSLAQCLLGLDEAIIQAAMEPERTLEFLIKLAEGQVRFIRRAIELGLGVIVFESATSPPLLSPRMFEEIALPPLKKVVEAAAEFADGDAPCFIGGDTASIVPLILRTGTSFVICPGETDRGEFLSAMSDHPDVKVRINMRMERYVGDADDEIVKKEIDEIVSLAAGGENICLGTGGIPFDVSIERVQLILNYCGS